MQGLSTGVRQQPQAPDLQHPWLNLWGWAAQALWGALPGLLRPAPASPCSGAHSTPIPTPAPSLRTKLRCESLEGACIHFSGANAHSPL